MRENSTYKNCIKIINEKEALGESVMKIRDMADMVVIGEDRDTVNRFYRRYMMAIALASRKWNSVIRRHGIYINYDNCTMAEAMKWIFKNSDVDVKSAKEKKKIVKTACKKLEKEIPGQTVFDADGNIAEVKTVDEMLEMLIGENVD